MGKDKHLTEADIAQYADAVNAGNVKVVPNSIRAHAESCDECAHEISMVANLSAELSEPTIKSTKKISLAMIGWSIAAGIALFFAHRYILPDTGTHNNVAHTTTDTVQKHTNDTFNAIIPTNNREQLAANKSKPKITKPTAKINEKDNSLKNNPKNHIVVEKSDALLAYAPHEDLEKLTNRFNGAAMRGGEIKVYTTSIIEGNKASINLEWSNTDKVPLIVEFYNNLGEKIFEEETTNSSYAPHKLTSPGLYYWKLINEDFDLLFCGKIIISK